MAFEDPFYAALLAGLESQGLQEPGFTDRATINPELIQQYGGTPQQWDVAEALNPNVRRPAPEPYFDRPILAGPVPVNVPESAAAQRATPPSLMELLLSMAPQARQAAGSAGPGGLKILEDLLKAKAQPEYANEIQLRMAAAKGDPVAKQMLAGMRSEKREDISQQAALTRAGQPIPEGTQKELTSIASLQGSISEIKKNFKKEFLGPLQGTDIDLSVRRTFGTQMGRPVSDQEITFRQNLDGLANKLIYLRSGAQINENEFARLWKELPHATDEAKVFQSGLRRFEAEFDRISTARRGLAGTSRGQVSQGATTPETTTKVGELGTRSGWQDIGGGIKLGPPMKR